MISGDAQVKVLCGIKYMTVEPFEVQTPFVGYAFEVILWGRRLCSQSESGLLRVEAFFPSDGASGPTVDSPSTFRGALSHDAHYLATRERKFPYALRDKVDDFAEKLWLEDGMGKVRAAWFRLGLRSRWAKIAALPGREMDVRTYP